MALTDPFIRRPVMTLLLMLGLAFFGLVAYFGLPVSYLPIVDYPVIQVTAALPGASPETMASTVAAPLEREFAGVNGLRSMHSTSTFGQTQVTIEFRLDTSLDGAANDVQGAISRASGDLPPEMPAPPYYKKYNPSEQPVIYLTMLSDAMPITEVSNYAQTVVSDSLSTVEGVGELTLYSFPYAVRVDLDPARMAARNITMDDVQAALAEGNVNMPVGVLQGSKTVLTLKANGQLARAADYRPLIVKYVAGQPVRLEEIATVRDGTLDERIGVWQNGRPAVYITVQRQPGANTITLADGVRKRLEQVRKQLPRSIELKIDYDRSLPVRASIKDVQVTLGIAIGLVVLVIFAFLRSVTSTIISCLTIPFSLIATFIVMRMLGFTLNMLSLMGLTLCIGFIVDDAIVVLENIVRHREANAKPFPAARNGAAEIAPTVLSMTLSLATTFVPLVFMAGLIGRILNELAVTIVAAILISGAVSLSLTPMLCSRLLGGKAGQKRKEVVFGFLRRVYGACLSFCLRLRPVTMLIGVALLVGVIWLFGVMPKGFLPKADLGYVFGFAMGRQGTSYEDMAKLQRPTTPIVLANPNVRYTIQVVGYGAQSEGVLCIILKPRDQRKDPASEVLMQLWGAVGGVPGVEFYFMLPKMITISSRSVMGAYEYTITSPNIADLYKAAGALTYELYALPQIMGVNSDLKIKTPQVELTIHRDKASSLGVTAEAIEDALYTAFGTRQVSTIYASDQQFKVITDVKPRFQRDPKALHDVYVRSTTGKQVRLDSIVDVKESLGPQSVNHTGQLPSVTFAFNRKPGVPLSAVTRAVEGAAAKALPPGVEGDFGGTASAFQQATVSMISLLLLAIAAIYIILGILYESFLHPIVVLSGLPAAAIGGLLTLMIFGKELDLFAYIGIIMLIGIVLKNGIMVVDFAIVRRQQGMSAKDAAHEAALVRFRPILMTTIAATMGALPLALGIGAGGDVRQPMGLAVVGGLIFSQIVTLFIIPVFYTYTDAIGSWGAARSRRRAIERGEIEEDGGQPEGQGDAK